MTRRLHRFVVKAAHILGREEAPAKLVRGDMDALAARIRSRLSSRRLEVREAAVLQQMLKTYDHYRSRLFACYRRPDLTRTTNELEQTFGTFRANERSIRAHTSTSRTARDGAFIAAPLAELRGRGPLPPRQLALVPETLRETNLAAMKCARQRHARPRTIRARFDAVLDGIGSYRYRPRLAHRRCRPTRQQLRRRQKERR
jgi:hypothetical protein